MSSSPLRRALPLLILLSPSAGLAQVRPAESGGPYAGVEVGAVDHHFVVEETSSATGTTSRNVSKWGAGGGVFAGYDADVAPRLRLGGEAAFHFGGRTPSATSILGDRLAIKPRYGFSLTARAGYAIVEGVRPYVGVGYGGHRYRQFLPAGVADFDDWNRSFILLGGVEFKASSRANVRLEFMHLDGTRNQVMLGLPVRF